MPSPVTIAAFAALALFVLLLAVLLLRRRPAATYDAGRIAAQLQMLGEQLSALPVIRARLDVDERVRHDISRRIEETQRALDALRLQADSRVRRDEELLTTTRRMRARR